MSYVSYYDNVSGMTNSEYLSLQYSNCVTGFKIGFQYKANTGISLFSIIFRQALGPTSSPAHCYRLLFLWINAAHA
jgi:hypothetical protein